MLRRLVDRVYIPIDISPRLGSFGESWTRNLSLEVDISLDLRSLAHLLNALELAVDLGLQVLRVTGPLIAHAVTFVFKAVLRGKVHQRVVRVYCPESLGIKMLPAFPCLLERVKTSCRIKRCSLPALDRGHVPLLKCVLLGNDGFDLLKKSAFFVDVLLGSLSVFIVDCVKLKCKFLNLIEGVIIQVCERVHVGHSLLHVLDLVAL